MSSIELLDLVSQSDEVIGVSTRDEIYRNKQKNFRVINAFIINKSKKIFIPKRNGNKKLFPSCLDCSVGGHVQSGETYEQAFFRETQEELNLEPKQLPFECIGYLSPFEVPISAFMKVFLIYFDHEINYSKDDFEDASWYSIQELKDLNEKKVPAKGDFYFLINLLIEKLS